MRSLPGESVVGVVNAIVAERRLYPRCWLLNGLVFEHTTTYFVSPTPGLTASSELFGSEERRSAVALINNNETKFLFPLAALQQNMTTKYWRIESLYLRSVLIAVISILCIATCGDSIALARTFVRQQHGCCTRCGYSIGCSRGPDHVCPECGLAGDLPLKS